MAYKGYSILQDSADIKTEVTNSSLKIITWFWHKAEPLQQYDIAIFSGNQDQSNNVESINE